MKLKRMLACLFIVAAFPLLASLSQTTFVNSVPFTAIVYAGHVSGGSYYCDCGSAGCICDPGELLPGGTRSTNSTQKKPTVSFDQNGSPVGADKADGLDIGTSAMLLAFALLVWARLLRI